MSIRPRENIGRSVIQDFRSLVSFEKGTFSKRITCARDPCSKGVFLRIKSGDNFYYDSDFIGGSIQHH